MEEQKKSVENEVAGVNVEPEVDAVVSEIVTEKVMVTEPVASVVEVAPENLAVSTSSKRPLFIALAIIVLAAAVAGAFWYNKTQQATPVEVGGVVYPSVVAIVNGEKVPVEDFKQSYEQAAAIATQQGFDPAIDEAIKEEVKQQAIIVMVNTVLMSQKAEEAGFTVTDEAVVEQVAKLETQFGGKEQLATALAGAGLTEEGMLSDLKEQILVDQYIAASPEWADIVVTEEEVKAYYDKVAAEMEGIPPYEEVSEQVRAQLEQEKQQAATNTLIERIRTESEIEVKI